MMNRLSIEVPFVTQFLWFCDISTHFLSRRHWYLCSKLPLKRCLCSIQLWEIEIVPFSGTEAGLFSPRRVNIMPPTQKTGRSASSPFVSVGTSSVCGLLVETRHLGCANFTWIYLFISLVELVGKGNQCKHETHAPLYAVIKCLISDPKVLDLLVMSRKRWQANSVKP